MRRFGLIAAVPLAALLFTGSVAAQDATPAPEGGGRVVGANECKGEPMAADAVMTAATTQPSGDLGYKVTIPLGPAVDADTRGAVSDAIRSFFGCLNANDNARAANQLTPTGIFVVFGPLANNPQTADAFKASLSKPPAPRPDEQALRLLTTTDVVDLGNNYLAALVTINDPQALPRGPQTLLLVLQNDNGVYKVANVITFTKVVAPQGTPEASPAAS
ncbi:MAG TPA: hypothetical protein VFI22_11020 [Thermomicrobiales bacterium]|nr:hypothetical protein [Thermomicrobiales bacterium]